MQRKWWMESIGYQIYPKSFYDSNGDGIGDLRGIIDKLDYLEYLGVNLLWICPVYESPMDDNGYDVSDYFNIAKEFGSLNDMKELLHKAKCKNMKVIMDLVLNHTSDEHPWFIESRKSKDNPYRDYYIWQQGGLDEFGNETEPTNWASFFTPSCWEKDEVTNQYYLHVFSKKMPDLNWRNEKMRYDLFEMAKWWLEFGIDGFRVDAINHIEKEWSFKNSKIKDENKYKLDMVKFTNRPAVHHYLKEMNQIVFSTGDIFAVGELGGEVSVDDALKYVSINRNELNMVFTFDHVSQNNAFDSLEPNWEFEINLLKIKEAFEKWQIGLYGKGWTPLNWLNHDLPRVLSQYGSLNYHKESAKMLANTLYFMWGTPFIYNGEEIGMTNPNFEDINDYIDIATTEKVKNLLAQNVEPKLIHRYIKLTARDNARTPMQWDDCENAGFTTGKPWMKVNPNYAKINVASQLQDETSILNHYRQIIKMRKESIVKDVIIYGTFEQLLAKNEQVFAYVRTYEEKQLLVISNFFETSYSISISDYTVEKVLLSNYDDSSKRLEKLALRPYESIVYEVRNEEN